MNPLNPLNPLQARRAVTREVVEALHDLARVLSATIPEFTDPIDKAALRDAQQAVMDVALTHDEAGGYGIYPLDCEDGGEAFAPAAACEEVTA